MNDGSMPPQDAQGTQADPGQQAEPQLLAGKYQSPEALQEGLRNLVDKIGPEDAYKTLESRLGGGGDAAAGASAPPPPPASMAELMERAGVAGEDLVAEYREHNGLTQERYEAFAKAGIPQEAVDSYFQGQSALIDLATERAVNAAGGEQQLQTLIEWAGKSYDDAKVQQLQAQLNNPSTTKDAVQAILNDYNGSIRATTARPLLQGQAVPPPAAGYGTIEEVQAAMREVRANRNVVPEHIKQRLARTDPKLLQGRL